jgi:hypothetical protein
VAGRADGHRGEGVAAPGKDIRHGYPHLPTVRSAITALYRRLSYVTVRTFPLSVPAADVAFPDQEDLHLGVQRIAHTLLRHLGLPDARMIVSFRDMEHAGSVELAAGPEYFIELNSRFRKYRRDIGAALAHEVMHVYLHRLDLSFPGTRDNEILTDTAAAYLGAGWLLLDAYREDALTSQKLGYLTPEEFGYVLAKRALAFDEDPAPWFASPQAYEAYADGLRRARRDEREPPLAAAGWAGRRRYAKDRRTAEAGARAWADARAWQAGTRGAAGPGDDSGYAFDGGPPLRVSFPCPTCRQRIRVPAGRGRMRARCGLCHRVLDCDT